MAPEGKHEMSEPLRKGEVVELRIVEYVRGLPSFEKEYCEYDMTLPPQWGERKSLRIFLADRNGMYNFIPGDTWAVKILKVNFMRGRIREGHWVILIRVHPIMKIPALGTPREVSDEYFNK